MAFSTVREQDRLKVRNAPYWHRLAAGQHLGLRKSDNSSTWLARAYDAATQKQVKRSLGDFGQLQANERFSAAAKAAREWFDHLGGGGALDIITVRQACERYAKSLESTGGRGGARLTAAAKKVKAKEARRRFAQYVNNDPIASVSLTKLHKTHLDAWRQRLEDTPAAFERSGKGAGRGRGKGSRTRPRAPTTVDRDMAVLKSALKLAMEDGYVLSATAWQKPLKMTSAHNRRELYVNADQRRELLKHIADDNLRAFVAALSALPLRPGALAALRARDFDARQGMLTIGKDKAGGGRKILLPASTAATFKHAARNKLPAAPLFARHDGTAWRTDEWGRGIKEAAKAAGLPDEFVAYTIRHSTISDLISPGKDASGRDREGLDLFSVAVLAGTSVEMIEKHYGHLNQKRAQQALAGLAL